MYIKYKPRLLFNSISAHVRVLVSLYIFIPRQSGGPRTFFFTYQMREYLNATRRVQYDK